MKSTASEQGLTIFIQFYISFTSKIYVCIAALYINTAMSFKSNMTKICYIFVPSYLFEKNICITDILRILVCDMVAMPGMLIPFAVRENLTGHL